MRSTFEEYDVQRADQELRALLIKSWVASGSVAALAPAVNASKPTAFHIPVLVAIISRLRVDAGDDLEDIPRRVRRTHPHDRSLFPPRSRPDRETPQPFQICHSWSRKLRFDPAVFNPYLPIMAICACIFFLLRCA
jgi:hypothetical protein